MKRRWNRILILCVLGLGLLVSYTNCSKLAQDVQFTNPAVDGLSNAPALDEVTIIDDPTYEDNDSSDGDNNSGGVRNFEAEINVTQKSMPIDMVWIIDNSGSMTAEANHVRKNLLSFINYISKYSDIKMALLSQAGNSGNYVSLPNPKNSPNYLQWSVKIGSHDSLDKTMEFMKTLGKNFLRQNSKKVFVFVTDDEAQVPAKQFLAAFNAAYPQQVPAVYGFVGLGSDKSNCQAGTGQQYLLLAKMTKSKMFNICMPDWTATFNTLAQEVVDLSLQPIQLPVESSKIEIVQVLLNGQPVHMADYRLSDVGLILSPRLFSSAGVQRVSVSYKLH